MKQIATLMLAGIMILGLLAGCGNSAEDKSIAFVKNKLADNTGMSYGQLLGGYCTDGEWKSDKNAGVVEFTGNSPEGSVVIQWVDKSRSEIAELRKDDYDIFWVELGGKRSDTFLLRGFMIRAAAAVKGEANARETASASPTETQSVDLTVQTANSVIVGNWSDGNTMFFFRSDCTGYYIAMGEKQEFFWQDLGDGDMSLQIPGNMKSDRLVYTLGGLDNTAITLADDTKYYDINVKHYDFALERINLPIVVKNYSVTPGTSLSKFYIDPGNDVYYREKFVSSNARSIYEFSYWMSYFIVTTDNKLYAFGSNKYGQLGIDSLDSEVSSDDIKLVTDDVANVYFSSIDATVFIVKMDGTLWAFGSRVPIVNKTMYAPVLLNSDVTDIDCEMEKLRIYKKDGSVWLYDNGFQKYMDGVKKIYDCYGGQYQDPLFQTAYPYDDLVNPLSNLILYLDGRLEVRENTNNTKFETPLLTDVKNLCGAFGKDGIFYTESLWLTNDNSLYWIGAVDALENGEKVRKLVSKKIDERVDNVVILKRDGGTINTAGQKNRYAIYQKDGDFYKLDNADSLPVVTDDHYIYTPFHYPITEDGFFMGYNVMKPSSFEVYIKNTQSTQNVSSILESEHLPSITVKAGVPVRWTIKAPDSTAEQYQYITLSDFGIESFKLVAGDNNIIEFTPNQTGTFAYSDWMGMYKGTITVE
jgi:hypothetical protein